MRNVCLSALFIMLSGCATSFQRARTDLVDQKVVRTVTVWIQAHEDLPKEDILDGCAFWNVHNIRCELAADPRRANLRFEADPKDCKEDKDDRKVLAWAHSGGRVVVHTDCFKRFLIGYNHKQLRSVAAHEIGHELGIWDHVPPTCDLAVIAKRKKEGLTMTLKTHPNGTRVCGHAVMNPECDPDLKFLTVLDQLAFDLRDRNNSIIRHRASAPGTPDCVLYAK